MIKLNDILKETKVQDLTQEIEVSAEMNNASVTEFAKAIAIALKNSYGTHTITKFMKVLHKGLGIK
jgi:hypothetical protein